jgi:hypothetical protein
MDHTRSFLIASALTLAIGATPALHGAEFTLSMNHNWNGLIHDGEDRGPGDGLGGGADFSTAAGGGFRTINDRAIIMQNATVDGVAQAGGMPVSVTSATSGLTYQFVAQPDVLDATYLGTSMRAFSANFGTGNQGVRPAWLPTEVGSSITSVTHTLAVPLLLDSDSRFGLAGHAAGGNHTASLRLTFSDNSTAEFLDFAVADWGVSGASALFNGTGHQNGVDNPTVGQNRGMGEIVFDLSAYAGKVLISFETFDPKRSSGNVRMAFYAATVTAVPEPASMALLASGALLMLWRRRAG